MPTGHSGYLDVTLHIGLVGLILFLSMLVAAMQAAARATLPAATSWLFVAVILYGLAHNLFETDWLDGFNLVWLAFVLVAVGAAKSRDPFAVAYRMQS